MNRKPIHILEENDLWKISIIHGNTDTVTISFSSTPRIGEPFAEEQFIHTSIKHGTAIFIIDKTSSYGNRLSWEKIVELIYPYTINKKLQSVGFCMGGFLAIAMSKYLKFDSVVAFTPQYSILEEYLIPDSYMIELYTKKISEWKIKTLDGHFEDDTSYYIFSSSDPDDLWQIKHFPKQENIKVFQFGDKYNHDLPGLLGDNMDIFVEKCFQKDTKAIEVFISNNI
jgi:hypothetical protein